jgi:hypothetical protein
MERFAMSDRRRWAWPAVAALLFLVMAAQPAAAQRFSESNDFEIYQGREKQALTAETSVAPFVVGGSVGLASSGGAGG